MTKRLKTYIELIDPSTEEIVDMYSYDGVSFDLWTADKIYNEVSQSSMLIAVNNLINIGFKVLSSYSKIDNRMEQTKW